MRIITATPEVTICFRHNDLIKDRTKVNVRLRSQAIGDVFADIRYGYELVNDARFVALCKVDGVLIKALQVRIKSPLNSGKKSLEKMFTDIGVFKTTAENLVKQIMRGETKFAS